MISDEEKAQLIERYNTATSHRELAEIEDKLWAGLPKEVRNQVRKRDWMTEHLGPRGKNSEYRSRLLHLGPATDVLWPLLDSSALPIRIAVDLSRAAKKKAKDEQIPLYDAMRAVMTRSRKVPKPIREEMKKVMPPTTAALEQPQNGVHEGPAKATITQTKEMLRQARGEIAKRVRELVVSYIGSNVESTTEIRILTAIQTLEAEIDAALSVFTDTLSRIRSAKRDEVQFLDKINRRDLIRACQVLGLDPPKPGSAVDMARARRRRSVLVQQFHPDARSGDESMRDQYENVLEAFEVLKSYEESRAGGGAKGSANA